ncbi:MAG TPA: hypothetical protein VH764_06020 [Gemmatimonadales bacterium]
MPDVHTLLRNLALVLGVAAAAGGVSERLSDDGPSLPQQPK